MATKSDTIIGKLPDTELLINSNAEKYANVVSSLLKEYSEKFNTLYISLYTKPASRPRTEIFPLVRRFENLITDGSQLLEHSDLPRYLQLELSIRLTEAEAVLVRVHDSIGSRGEK